MRIEGVYQHLNYVQTIWINENNDLTNRGK